LPYNTASDPLYIAHEIDSILTLQGSQTLDRFASFLRPFGLASEDEFDENNSSEDALERASRSKFPSRTEEAGPLAQKDFDMSGFVDLCREGFALLLALRLRSFLCRLYNLSETRILEFDPSAKERVGEKGVSKATSVKPFDASVPPVLLQRKGRVDTNALIRQYA
jgi:hypothetical protein